MKKIIKYALGAFLFSITCFVFGASSQVISKKTIELDPIKMTYTDFSDVLSNIQVLIKSANQSVPKKEFYEESVDISISSEQDTIRVTGWKSIKEEKYLPPQGYSVRFNYSYPNAPISDVTLILADGLREIQVSGVERSQVNAVSLALRDSLDKYSTKFGGFGFRMVFALTFLVLVLFLTSYFFHKQKYFQVVLTVVLVSAEIIIFALPWDKWIAGFTIYLDSASFIDRNINMISFISLLVTFVFPLIGFGVKAFSKETHG